MTDRYAHFEPSDFIKAKEVQEALLLPVTAQEAETAGQNVTVLAFPVKQNELDELRKQA
jgi:hypothetical protein